MASIITFMTNEEATPYCNSMDFPDTFEEFAKSYGIKDREEVYTNGSVLIPVFRVKQWLDHINSCEDIISREHLLSEIDNLMQSPWFNNGKNNIGALRHGYVERKEAVEVVRDLCVKAEPDISDMYPSLIKRPCPKCKHKDSIYICENCVYRYDSRYEIEEEESND